MNTTKHILLSLATLGLFVFFAVASIGPDKSTNTSVAIKDCESKPPVNGMLTINVTIKKSDGTPAQGISGTLFVIHQKVDTDTCTYTTIHDLEIPFVTNSQGKFNYQTVNYMHDNSQDLFRVEIKAWGVLNDVGSEHDWEEMNILFYDQSNFVFSHQYKSPLIPIPQ